MFTFYEQNNVKNTQKVYAHKKIKKLNKEKKTLKICWTTHRASNVETSSEKNAIFNEKITFF